MSFGARGAARQRTLRWVTIAAAILVVLALIFLLSGSWILGIVFGALAVGSIWLLMQLRSVR
jgi:hypothetical protein